MTKRAVACSLQVLRLRPGWCGIFKLDMYTDFKAKKENHWSQICATDKWVQAYFLCISIDLVPKYRFLVVLVCLSVETSVCDSASSACLWAATSSIASEQGWSLSGPPEIALTICLSLGDRVMLGRGCGCGALTLVCLCWHELLSPQPLRWLPECLWLSQCVCCITMVTFATRWAVCYVERLLHIDLFLTSHNAIIFWCLSKLVC